MVKQYTHPIHIKSIILNIKVVHPSPSKYLGLVQAPIAPSICVSGLVSKVTYYARDKTTKYIKVHPTSNILVVSISENTYHARNQTKYNHSKTKGYIRDQGYAIVYLSQFILQNGAFKYNKPKSWFAIPMQGGLWSTYGTN